MLILATWWKHGFFEGNFEGDFDAVDITLTEKYRFSEFDLLKETLTLEM